MQRYFVCLVLLFFAAFASCEDPSIEGPICDYWLELTPPEPKPTGRNWQVSFAVGDDVYIFGGATEYGTGTVYNDLWAYNILANEWRSLTPATSEVFAAATGDLIGGDFLVFGGADTDGEYNNDLREYNVDDDEWSLIQLDSSSVQPEERNGHSSASLGGSIFIFGGWDSKQYYNDLWEFNTRDLTWSLLHSGQSNDSSYVAPAPRNGHTADFYGGDLVIFGGFKHIPEPVEFYNDMWMFSTTTRQWTKVEYKGSHLPLPRFSHTSVIYGSSLFIFGGTNDPAGANFLDDFWMFSFSSRKWTQIFLKDKESGPSTRQGHSAVVVGSSMYLFGGQETGAGPWLADLWKHDLGACIEDHYMDDLENELSEMKGLSTVSLVFIIFAFFVAFLALGCIIGVIVYVKKNRKKVASYLRLGLDNNSEEMDFSSMTQVSTSLLED